MSSVWDGAGEAGDGSGRWRLVADLDGVTHLLLVLAMSVRRRADRFDWWSAGCDQSPGDTFLRVSVTGDWICTANDVGERELRGAIGTSVAASSIPLHCFVAGIEHVVSLPHEM